MRALTLLVAAMLFAPSAGLAGPQPLSDDDLGEVTGGLFDVYVVMPVVVVHNNNNAVATGIHSQNVSADAVANVSVNPVINMHPTDQVGSMGPVVLNAPLAGPIIGPNVFAPAVAGSSATTEAMSAAPIWVPWAAELRGSLGIR